MTQLEELQERRRTAYQELLGVSKLYKEAKINFEALELKYIEAQGIYNSLEYRCAELDGRLTHIEESKKSTTKSSREKRIQDEESTKDFLKSMDKDALDKLLAECGVVLPEVPEVPDDEPIYINENGEEIVND